MYRKDTQVKGGGGMLLLILFLEWGNPSFSAVKV